MNQEIDLFLQAHTERVEELSRRKSLAWWNHATTGREEHAQESARCEVEFRKLYSDRESYRKIKGWLENERELVPLVQRQIELLSLAYASRQQTPEEIETIVSKEKAIEAVFNNHRAELRGRKLSDNEITRILEEEDDSETRRAAWEASKQIGTRVADSVLDLVRLRNDSARKMGFRNFFSMTLEVTEIEEDGLWAALGKLEELTTGPFEKVKSELDRELAARFRLSADELRPWHYADPYFQRAPAAPDANLDPFFKQADLAALTVETYERLGLEIRDILGRSDLEERAGKSQHAFCSDMDRKGDIRVLSNNRPSEKWAGTMLHEFGHAVYNKYIDRELPFLLRKPAHSLTTEGAAMLLGRLTQDFRWLVEIGKVPVKEAERLAKALRKQAQRAMLVFIRWGLVVVHFEKAMYENPRQDLARLWWDLVERFQRVRRPAGREAPDWAAKIHIATVPAYYQSYVLGELFASQVEAAIFRTVEVSSLIEHENVGRFLVETIFQPGAKLHWQDLLRRATGEPLNPKYFVRQATRG